MPACTNLPPTNINVDPIEIEDDDICQAEILEILGTDPSLSQEYGDDINKEVARRFEHIATSGLEKQARQELLEKYLVPANCVKIAAPQLNAEIKAASTEAVIKRDKAIELRQKQIAAAITGVGRILTSQLKSKDNNVAKDLMDVARLLCDIQFCESTTRRNFTLYPLKKDFRDQLANTKIDKYLFGEDLPETLKTAKAVSKSSTDIKVDQQKSKQQTTPKFPKNLNWKTGPSARNQPKGPTQKQYQSAASSSRRYGHGNSSHRSSHRAKHSRRR
ncbi:uncharacterized protein LOC125236362 [Leguminivora glycinivorella]|nr:uncharacterized protein LOC125236362 [Leguminivora glycinivorella]